MSSFSVLFVFNPVLFRLAGCQVHLTVNRGGQGGCKTILDWRVDSSNEAANYSLTALVAVSTDKRDTSALVSVVTWLRSRLCPIIHSR